MFKKTKKPLLTVVIFVISILTIRLLWSQFLNTLDYANPPTAQDGILDLRHFSFNQRQTLELNGEWEFYPETFLFTDDGTVNNVAVPSERVMVPGAWNELFHGNPSSFRYGTYRLRILLDEETEQTFGIRVSRIGNASSVFINGQLAGASGNPSAEIEGHQSKNLPYMIAAPAGQGLLEIVIQVSHHGGDGGIYKPIRFGTIDAIQDRNYLLIGLQLLLCVIALFNSLYGLILYYLGAKNKGIGYFFALMILVALSTLISDDELLFQWLDLGYEWEIKIIFATYTGIIGLIPPLISNLFPRNIHPNIMKGFVYSCAFFLLFIILSPSYWILNTTAVFFRAAYLLCIAISIFILIKAVREKRDVIYLILAVLSVGNNMVWSIAMHHTPTTEIIHYPFDLIAAILAFSAFWFGQYFHVTNQSLQLTEKLIREDKRKDEFLINTSHELRNPLQAISNMIQVVLDDRNHPIPTKQMERIEIVKNVSRRMNILLDDLIDITRLKEKTIPLELKPVYLQSVASGVLDLIKVMLEGKPIELHVDVEDTFPAVHADENRVIQVLFNLLHNAVKFTDKGTITIRAIRRGPMAEIQVEDTGVGISEEALDAIFLPYEQADPHSDRASGGFGLGLNICKQLVELHRGTLQVTSEVGKGSTFRFTLPFAEEREPASQEKPPLSAGTTERMKSAAAEASYEASGSLLKQDASVPKVLIVDDDAVNLNVLAQTLEPDGYRLTSVTSAEQALEQIAKHRYDLVITDVMMPQTSGYELTRIIRERFNVTELPILLLTARVRTEDIVAGFQAEANDYVKKPADAWELRARVRALIQFKLSVEERLRIESAWLQTQIQPHFLYNTLNSIAALGLVDFEKMQTLLHEFSNYLRLSFDFKNASPLIALERELFLVRSYVYIEQQRFGDRVKVEWNIEKEVQIKVPPLSIQPLVENAIKHGITGRNRGGTVSISIRNRSGIVEITVKDDGVGMSENVVEQLFSPTPHSEKYSRVGLRNIERRLQQQFRSGLKIESAPNQGTSVSFQIPYEKKE